MNATDKYCAIYKCQLCGALFAYGNPVDAHLDQLPGLCGKIVGNQQFRNNPWLYQAPMQLVHRCPSGGCGLAYFAGFNKCNE